MDRLEIISLLNGKHHSFTTYINSLADRDFVYSRDRKWTAGQQLRHILLAVRPVVLAMHLPRWLIRILFGRPTRSGRSYDELVKTYVGKLENGAKASLLYIPKEVRPEQKDRLIAALNAKVNSLCARIEMSTEGELDMLRLPHPILGKLTLREMLYFTIYHVQHHEAAIRRNLSRAS